MKKQIVVVALSVWLTAGMAVAADGEPTAYAGIVAAHNQTRQNYGVPPLKWSSELAAVAQNWADRLGARGCPMEHSHDHRFGENLAWTRGMRATPAQIVSWWAAEAKDYDLASRTCQPGAVCGHFTQIVWRTTQEVGCGQASCGGDEVWVCNYGPPGNIIGRSPF